MCGTTVNIYADLPFHKIKNTSKFKAAVAGDRIEGQFKNQQSFFFESYCKHIYATNRPSKSEDDTYGWYKRWVLLHFKYRIPKEMQDKDLIKKLTTPQELSGILNLALGGLKLLKRDGGFDVGSIVEIQKEYEKQSSLVKEFVMENYHVDAGNESPDYVRPTEDVQGNFIEFLKSEEGWRLQYIKNEITNCGFKDRTIDLDKNNMDRWIVCGLLGRELAAMGVDNKKVSHKKTGTRPHCYVGLKLRVGYNNTTEDGFEKSALQK
jgi:hypothetical protein